MIAKPSTGTTRSSSTSLLRRPGGLVGLTGATAAGGVVERLVTAIAVRDVLAGGAAAARALDRRLHGLVGAAARIRPLVALTAHLTTAATPGSGAEPYEPDFFVRALHEHEELIGAVVAGDAERAPEVATAHCALTSVATERSLRRAGEG